MRQEDIYGRAHRIIGIVGGFAYADPANTDPEPLLFVPLTQHYSSSFFVVLRGSSSVAEMTSQLRQATGGFDSTLPIESVRTLEDLAAERYQISRIPAELLSVYAVSSVLVAMLGLTP